MPDAPAASGSIPGAPISVAPFPLLSFARWKRLLKPVPVEAFPLLVIGAWNVVATPAVTEVGMIAPGTRSGCRACWTEQSVNVMPGHGSAHSDDHTPCWNVEEKYPTVPTWVTLMMPVCPF